MSINYSSAIPENNKSSYGEYDTVDFVLTFPNESLKLGSLRLEGEFEVTQDGNPLNDVANANKDIKYDKFIGCHSVVESVQTEMLNEVFENLTEYPRMVKHYAVSNNSTQDLFNSSNACELRVPYDAITTEIMKGVEPRTQIVPAIRENPDFSVKLDMLLNSTVADLPYKKSGAIRISVNLARNVAVFHGKDVDANTKYELKDLRLTYRTVSNEDNMNPIVLRRRINIKQSIQSSLANIQTKVPSESVEAFSASLQVQSHENTFFYNNIELDKIPNLKQLQFLFNDQTNAQVAYLVKSNSEVVEKFIEALGDSKKNQMAPTNMINNNGYGIGLRMSGGMINLTNQKFSVQIDSEISNNVPYLLHMYFHTVVEV